MGKFTNFLNGVKTFFSNVKNKLVKGYKWLGIDGIVNMETSALLVMLFMVFFPVFWAAILTFLIVIGKCTFDKSRGRENEKHDFICCIVGILLGVILGTVHIAVSLL
jgi:hypothetical protein